MDRRVRDSLNELDERLTELEKKIAELEQQQNDTAETD